MWWKTILDFYLVCVADVVCWRFKLVRTRGSYREGGNGCCTFACTL